MSIQQDILQPKGYSFCYYQNKPYTLTITKTPKLIHNLLYTQATYIWLFDQNRKQNLQQIQQKAEVKIEFLPSISKIIGQYKNHQRRIIVISHYSQLEQVQIGLISMSNKISCFIFYDCKESFSRIYDVNTYYFDTEQKAIKQINSSKIQYSCGDFVNFISLQKQVWDSNILVKTLLAMINQPTNTKQLIQQFKQLALYSTPLQSDVFQFVNQYQERNGQLNDERAIWWYVRESFLFRIVNRVLRILRDPTCLYIIQFYIKDLFHAIQQIYKKQKSGKAYRKFICYRGGEISDNEVQFFRENKGSLIQNLGFLSTSRREGIANTFVSNALFEIQVDDSEKIQQVDYGFADLKKFSNQGEDQVLFNPLNTFKIIDFFDDSQQNLFKIRLKYGQMARLLTIQNDKLSQLEINCKLLGQQQVRSSQKCMSHVLIQDGYNLEGAQEYSQKFNQIAQNCQCWQSISHGHFIKAYVALNLGNYKLMEKQLIQQQQILSDIMCNNQSNKKQILSKIATNLNNLATSLVQLAQYHQAVQIFLRSQAIYYKQFGEYHPQYATTLNNLAYSFSQIGSFHKAIQYLEKAEKIQTRLIGDSHPDYAVTLNNLGTNYGKLGHYQKTLDYLQRCEEIRKKTLGDKHPVYAATLNNLAMALYKIGQKQNALKCLQRSSNVFKKILGKTHPKYAKILNNFATLFCNLGEYKKAVEYFKQCEKIEAQSLGVSHPGYAVTLNNLGICFINVGQLQKAVKYLKKCLQIQGQVAEKNNTGYAKTLNNLGTVYRQLGLYQRSVWYFEKCEYIQKRIFGEQHPDYSITLVNLSILWFEIGEVDKAQSYAKKSGNSQQISKFQQVKKAIKKLQQMNQDQMIRAISFLQTQIQNLLKFKYYKQSIKTVKYFISISQNLVNSHRDLFIEKMHSLFNNCLIQAFQSIERLFDSANKLQVQGKFQQAQQIYSVQILQKYQYLWRYLPSQMGNIEIKLGKIEQKKRSNISHQLLKMNENSEDEKSSTQKRQIKKLKSRRSSQNNVEVGGGQFVQNSFPTLSYIDFISFSFQI